MISNAKRLTGPQAGSAKYDVLTALAMLGLHGGAAKQATSLRLIAVVTARYNWRNDELSVCQRDMARMWGVSERTAKRDVKTWISERWLIVKRQGVRGRAGAYRLDLVEIGRQASALWDLVGTDFADRLGVQDNEHTVIKADFGKPKSVGKAERGSWMAVSERLRETDPGMHGAWIQRLTPKELSPDKLVLQAPSKFAAHYIETNLWGQISDAVAAEMGIHMKVTVTAD